MAEQLRITCNKFCSLLSHLARSMADLVFNNGRFWAIFGTIVLIVHDDR